MLGLGTSSIFTPAGSLTSLSLSGDMVSQEWGQG